MDSLDQVFETSDFSLSDLQIGANEASEGLLGMLCRPLARHSHLAEGSFRRGLEILLSSMEMFGK